MLLREGAHRRSIPPVSKKSGRDFVSQLVCFAKLGVTSKVLVAFPPRVVQQAVVFKRPPFNACGGNPSRVEIGLLNPCRAGENR